MEVPCSYAEKWEGKVSELCQSKQKPKLTTHGMKHKANVMDCGDRDDDAKQNQIAAGLKLTEETYDGCESLFIAADREWQKASRKYFNETGIMAAVCHHGAPLFYVSIWMPGEQQFYILTLLSKLIKHLPQSWTVGCLYDIGCQMDHSLKKWDIMPEWKSCLVWGVSIFHAYGHQWACQLWYHP